MYVFSQNVVDRWSLAQGKNNCGSGLHGFILDSNKT